MSEQNYTADSIRVLRGLEPVRARPGMYTRTEDPTHIIQEVLDNAADEALAGYAQTITVTLFADGSAEVADTGRGIPVEVPKGEKVSAAELVFTQLHAGGKFDKTDEESSYKFSGGLHGVGVSVTNALSTRLEVEICRDGVRYTMAFAHGEVVEKLATSGKCLKRDTGTRVRAWPDPKYFDSPKINLRQIEHLVRSKAMLMPGVQMKLVIEEADGNLTEKAWHYENGIIQYLEEMVAGREMPDDFEPIPVVAGSQYAGQTADGVNKGEGAEWAVVFLPGAGGSGESYVNLIPTPGGGTHEAGLRNGLFEAVKSFMDHHSLVQRGVKVSADDVWSNLNFVLSAKVLDPQFQGQTKDRLTSRDTMKVISASGRVVFENWLNQNADHGKRIVELANRSAAARTRAAAKFEKRKSSGVNIMPAKLTDCEMAGTLQAELFLVEGDSAGGSAKMGRSNEYQSLLPLRGKVLNTWEVDAGTIFANAEVHDIFVALGIDPHKIGDTPDLSGLRYGKLIIMSDADVDGSHIQVLLLTLFLKHAPALIEHGHVYVAQPPLYRIDVPSQGKGKPARKLYVADDAEKQATIDSLRREGVAEDRLSVQRFKGLGEMNPEQLWETTMCPDTRRLVQMRFTREEIASTLAVFDSLMKKKESAAREEMIKRLANEVEADI